MKEVVLVSAVRTAIGRRNGALAGMRADELLGKVLRAVVDRVELDPVQVEDILCDVVTQVGEQGFILPRIAALTAGFPLGTPGITVNRQCGSSLTAINLAAGSIAAGYHDCLIACGCEIMSKYPIAAEWFNLKLTDGQEAGIPWGPGYMKLTGGKYVDQGQAAEMIANKWGLTKYDLDAFSLRSHQRAARATEEGRFKREIIPLEVTLPDGQMRFFDTDETIRPDTSMEKLASLKPVFGTQIITAGNASPITDGASAILLMTLQKANELGIKPRARLVTCSVAGADPVIMLTGPIPATQKVLKKGGLDLKNIDKIEINEAFAPIPLAWGKEFNPDWDKVNPNGGAIALGHPVGNSGCRLMVTCLHELERIGGRYGLVTLCTGGGMAPATIIERLG